MLLRVKSLTTSFDTPHGKFLAVDDVSFELKKGETLGIVGESGSGKSLTALSLLQLIPKGAAHIDGGQIFLNDTDLLDLSQSEMRAIRGKKIGMIFQEPMTSLNPVFSVGNQIEEAILTHERITNSQARAKTLEMMDLVGIPDPKARYQFYPHQMSGGLRQRVMIAIALSCHPEILIADEPTTALDVTIQSQILELMKDLQNKLGMSIILISHDFGLVSEYTDRVLVMYAGKILEEGASKQTFLSPRHPYTKALKKSVPLPNSRGTKLYTIPFVVPSTSERISGINLDSRWKKIDLDISKFESEKLPERKIENEIILQAESLKVYYPVGGGFLGKAKSEVRAVDDLSFSIRKGEVLGLVGESGCGKSTLGKCIAQLVRKTEGRIFFNSRSFDEMGSSEKHALRKDYQMVFQDPFSSLNPRMKVGDIIEEPLHIHQLGNKKSRRDKAIHLLKLVGLEADLAKKFPHEFSGGQRQRIGIARALAVEPKLIIADEPVSALDVSIQAQILNLLLELQQKFQLSYLFISHDINVVHYLCDQILVMNQGKLVESLLPSQLFDKKYQKKAYTEHLLSSVPSQNFATPSIS